MLDAVLNAVTSALSGAGLAACRQFPEQTLSKAVGPVVCVGVKSNKLLSAGSGDYMGERSENGAVCEVYGWRAEVVLALDVYSPDDGENGAGGCAAAFETLASALTSLPSGLRQRALICGETAWDEATGMFLCRSELHALALLTREESADTGAFTDFVLRGVMK